MWTALLECTDETKYSVYLPVYVQFWHKAPQNNPQCIWQKYGRIGPLCSKVSFLSLHVSRCITCYKCKVLFCILDTVVPTP